MATSVIYNGVNYSIPSFGDTGYAQGAGNLSLYLVALATGSLQTTGGVFSLLADANFGVNFGLIAKYFTSVSALPATSGSIRLANTDTIDWRNFANSGNDVLAVNSSDQLTYNGSVLSTAAAGITALTGDVTATGPGSAVATLATVNSNVGSFTNASITVNGKGLITAASSGSAAVTSVTGTANQVNSTGGATPVLSLSSTLVLPGTLTTNSITVDGNITFSPTTDGIVGTITNNNASAGLVGEWIQSSALGAAPPSTGAFGDLALINLTAGDWDISGVTYFQVGTGTWTAQQMGISPNSGTSLAGLVLGDSRVLMASSASNTLTDVSLSIPSFRVSLAAPTTYYLKYSVTYATQGTLNVSGRISARRMR